MFPLKLSSEGPGNEGLERLVVSHCVCSTWYSMTKEHHPSLSNAAAPGAFLVSYP